MKITQNLKDLLEELGGKERASQRIQSILSEFYGIMSRDLMLGFFFTGKDLPHIIEQQKNFLLRALGAVTGYKGKPPARAHTKIAPILKGHFDRRLFLLREILAKNGLSQAGIEAWVSFEEQFRKSIVKK